METRLQREIRIAEIISKVRPVKAEIKTEKKRKK